MLAANEGLDRPMHRIHFWSFSRQMLISCDEGGARRAPDRRASSGLVGSEGAYRTLARTAWRWTLACGGWAGLSGEASPVFSFGYGEDDDRGPPPRHIPVRNREGPHMNSGGEDDDRRLSMCPPAVSGAPPRPRDARSREAAPVRSAAVSGGAAPWGTVADDAETRGEARCSSRKSASADSTETRDEVPLRCASVACWIP